MDKIKRLIIGMLLFANAMFAQDTTSNDFDMSEYEEASTSKKYCTQKILNQTPTKQFSFGYETNLGFKHDSNKIKSMGGVRASANFLAISTNKLILSLGLTYWGSKIRSDANITEPNMQMVYNNRMDIEGFNASLFKPLNSKHFIIAQANLDAAHMAKNNQWKLSEKSITYYGSAMFGWKKGDYRMLGLGLSRTYRLGRPLIVPILLYNKTFNDKWGVETLLPARAHVRYNHSMNTVLLAGYELEGQQFGMSDNPNFLQRGEIKPRLVLEQKLHGFFWLSVQAGYRVNGRFNIVNRYNGQEKNEIIKNNWGGSPYINLSLNFVTP